MTPADIAALQVLVQSAITSILTGTAQSVSIAGRTYTALDLDKLWVMLKNLNAEATMAAAGGARPAVIRFVGAPG